MILCCSSVCNSVQLELHFSDPLPTTVLQACLSRVVVLQLYDRHQAQSWLQSHGQKGRRRNCRTSSARCGRCCLRLLHDRNAKPRVDLPQLRGHSAHVKLGCEIQRASAQQHGLDFDTQQQRKGIQRVACSQCNRQMACVAWPIGSWYDAGSRTRYNHRVYGKQYSQQRSG